MKRRQKPTFRATPPEAAPLPAQEERIGVRGEWLLGAGLVAVTALTYLPVLNCGFVNLDDPLYVTQNTSLRLGLTPAGFHWAWTEVVSGHRHPLTLMSLLIDYQLFGDQPWGYHLVNLLLHMANTLLLFRCLRLLTGAVGRSAMVAALFALHPLHVESVAWVTERKDVLGTFFLLLALRAYAWYAVSPKAARMALVAIPFLLSLLAKSMWVTFPFVLLLLDYWPLRRLDTWRRLVVEKWSLFAITAAICIATMLSQKGRPGAAALSEAAELPFPYRLGNAFLSYFHYLRQTVVPNDLAPFYPHPAWSLNAGAATAAAAMVVGVSALAFYLMRRVPYLFVGWFWYVGSLVPGIGLVQVGNLARADHFTYVPLIGIFILLTWGAADLLRRVAVPRLAPVLAGVVLFLCALSTLLQIAHWKDSLAMWEHTVAVTSNNFAAHRNYGLLLLQRRRYEEAQQQLEAGLTLWPSDSEALRGLAECRFSQGKVYLRERQFAQAAECFETAARLSEEAAPERAAAWLWRAEALAQLGRTADTLESLIQGADAYARLGDFPRAIEVVNAASARADPERHASLIRALQDRRQCFEKQRTYRPD
jgi:hypothetical protein